MLALFAPAMLLLGAVTAQVTPTQSVVTFISISPVPTSEGVFTIQTSVPGSPGGVTPVFSEGSMGIPPGETPIPSSLLSSLLSNITTGSITPSRSSGGTPASSSGTPPAQQSTAAASSSLQGDGTPLRLALAVSGLVLVGGTFILI